MNICKLMSFAAFAACLAGCEKKAAETVDRRPLVRVGAVANGAQFADALAVQGMVRAKNTASIAARVPGTIDALLTEEGAVVKKGTPLFRIDQVNLANAVRAAKDDLAMAKAKLAQAGATDAKARLDVERMARLVKEGAVTKDMFEKADVAAKSYAAALDAAKATLTKAETGLAVAEKNFADSEVKAPFDGVITKKLKNAGDFCGAGMKIFEMEDSSCYEVCVSLNAAQYGRVKVGETEMEVKGQQAYDNKTGAKEQQACDNKTGAKEQLACDNKTGAKEQLAYGNKTGAKEQQAYDNKTGAKEQRACDNKACCRALVVTYKSPAVNPLTRTFEVRAVVKKTDALAAGMLVDARVVFARRTAQAVPAAAVAKRGGGDCLFKVVDGKVVRVPVEAGLSADGLREIVSPKLSPADQLIVEGMLLVNEGDEVRVVGSSPAARPDPRPRVMGSLIAPEDADYVRKKFREDVTEPGTGLDLETLSVGAEKIARESFAAEGEWKVAKAKAFAWICTNMAVSASEHDIFPAISCYRHMPRAITKAIRWRDREVDAKHFAKECEAIRAGRAAGRFCMWKDYDHSVPPWDEMLAGGWPMLAARLDKYDNGKPYYRALRITLDACLATLGRFAAAARTAAAQASTAEKRARLLREAEAFENIRTAPPHTCYEALVFQWSYFFLSEHLDCLQVRALGPLDILLTPFYRADLKTGRVTPESFKRDLAYYWWQYGSIDNYWGQPVALGGTKADGTTEFNEVSDLILDVHDELALPTPKMLVKIAPNTPDRVFDRMLGMAARHRSITFDGEQGLKRSLQSWRGCTDEECRTCDLNGCYEFYVHGAQNITQSSHISFLQPLADLLRAYAAGAEAPAAYEAFVAAYLAELRRNTTECCDLTDAWERSLDDICPGNVYSLTIESAVRDGRDAFANGMKYNDTALLSVGLGTTVDALLAVKELVYEKREFSLAELGQIMAANWKGHEELRQRMLRSKRKWGNNLPEANETGAEIVRAISSWVNGRKNARGGIWGFSGHPARQFIDLMRQTGATPDGRLAGEESSKNLSPTMGADTEGVTALVSTLSHLRPEDLPVNFPLDVQLLPSAVHGAQGLAAMRTLARVYFANGGETLQFNVFDVAELKDAQAHPEKYENLQVRVCGWNVRWNDLPKSEQDAYIRRAENIQ